MIKVLIVDDSAFMRKALTSMLQEDPEIKVVGTARDGVEALQMIQDLRPDVVTMDVEMPRMDGITALKEIMSKCPVPVIMVSSLTTEGAKVTLEALDLGAVDFIPKNLSELSVNIVKIKGMLLDKIKTIGRRGIVKRKPFVKTAESKIETPKIEVPKARISTERKVGIVSIGTSTGGPKALQEIIPKLPKDFPVPIVVAQHMPPNFTKPFSERLDQLSQLSVKEAEEGETIKPGIVYVAPGRGHMRLKRRGIETFISISEDKEEFIYRPSVDALMLSVAECFPGRSLGVILTGMGNDGARGCKKIKETGGRVFAQNEETCVVYGMPRAVVEAGLADKIVSLDEMAGEIINAV
ncbi:MULTISPECIES: protein-glutamate methylesterase/protein-glutamine glutaminase [Thermodesulfovibrio]|jgi:two-component system chemotaxis response regulator CheB|uniref:protein-glutamate methylesterase/protein-glutamine glutaminase n=1 Tax=Thermodesulfovibrio TaxID=28261 RepID=UPI00262EA77D|nr:chemotaxis response regulator protein-glutamate methylesterase [Thermodesulfovibrio sp.]